MASGNNSLKRHLRRRYRCSEDIWGADIQGVYALLFSLFYQTCGKDVMVTSLILVPDSAVQVAASCTDVGGDAACGCAVPAAERQAECRSNKSSCHPFIALLLMSNPPVSDSG